MTRLPPWAARLLWGVAGLALAGAAIAWISGGMTLSVAGLRLRVSQPLRPLGLAVLATGFLLVSRGRRQAIADLAPLSRWLTPTRAAIALACTVTIVGLTLGSWTASGPDSFAYVSQAALWRRHHLAIPLPLAAEAPWPNARATFTPFGYAAPPDGPPRLVPITAPGVPLLMALLQGLGGHAAAFVVTPVLAGVLVLAVFAIGRRWLSPAAGLIAAWLIATSPAWLFMLMWPMSDIPASTATALLMLALLDARRVSTMVLAGVAASWAVLMRPNMTLVVGAATLWALATLARDRHGRRMLLGYAVGLLPGVATLAGVNWLLYGSPVASGYGTAGTLLAADRLVQNAGRYGTWFTQTSPVGWLGIAALLVPLARIWGAEGRRLAWLSLAIAGATCSIYLVYGDFTDWWYLRFLLPAWPAVFLATAAALVAWSRTTIRTLLVGLLAVGIGLAGVRTAIDRGVFAIGAGERRYAAIAAIVAAHTPPEAVILTVQHAGTVAYYSGRTSLRYDELDPAWLDRALVWLSERGRPPFILVEDWEQPGFDARFGAINTQGRLSYAPLVAWEAAQVKGWVFLYDPRRRDASTVQPGAALETRQPFSAPMSSRWPGP